MEIERKVFEAEVKEFDEKDLSVVHFISTEKRDRGRDILYADGMKMEGRPVVLFQHGWTDNVGPEPIAKPVWIKKGEFKNRKGIQAKTQFFPDELGKRLWQKTVEGYMPNWSVGWRPLRHEYKTERDGVEIRHVYEWELLEYSLVAVPMQPDAQTPPNGKEIEEILFKMLPENEEKFGELVAWKHLEYGEINGVQVRVKEFWEEKPYPNEHACRLEDPGKYIRIRRENDKFGKGIHAIWGVQAGSKPVELQAIRFDKTKFTAAEARSWLKSHKYTCKMFEPASEKCEKCDKLMIIKWDQDVSGEKCGATCEASFTYEHDGKCEKEEPPPEVISDKLKEFINQAIADYWKVTTDKLMMGLVTTDNLIAIENQIKDLSAQVSALSEAEKKRAKEPGHQPSDPRQVLIVNTDDQKNEALKQISQALTGTITKVIKETVKEELDRLRGKVN